MKSIQSRDNPTYRQLRQWATSAKARKADKVTLLEGRRLVEAFAQSGGRANFLVMAESSSGSEDGAFLSEMIDAMEHVVLPDALFSSLSEVKTFQGVLAVAQVPDTEPWPTVGETLVLLEDIQDPGNLGSIIRSTAAAGIAHVVLSSGCASAWSPKVVRAGMGAHFHVALHEGVDLGAIIRALKMPVVATTPEARVALYQADVADPVAWLFGNEGNGLSEALLHAASLRLRVPMAAGSESLNVAATVAVCLFEQMRQRTLNT